MRLGLQVLRHDGTNQWSGRERYYQPAGKVSGDFFQIVPLDHGRALVAIGDVCGKGMPAAMTVSLLVGIFRTLTEFIDSPGQILAHMNQGIFARNHGGFTTCLIARLEPDGSCTLANAGHIPPWLNGGEVQLDGGLPLGLVANASYPECSLHLSPSDRLSLVTDGVTEARGTNGELFGFERTREISSRPPKEIAAAAQRFGQTDDITVLGVSLATPRAA